MTRPTLLEPESDAPPAAVVDAAKRRWRAGVEPDAAGVVRDHPELLGYRSLAVDLAYEEFCLREEAGDAPDPEAFAARFPAFRSALREVLRGHLWFAEHPDLLPPAPPAWPEPGDAVEGCRVVAEIGRGAFARVYLAADPQVGRHVVVKVAPGGSAEARAMGKVRHPHVIDVYWARPAAGLFALGMPFVAVATLQDVCDAVFPGPVSGSPADSRVILDAIRKAEEAVPVAPPQPDRAVLTGGEGYVDGVLAVAGRIADGLAALHRAGVVHGDLKPSNILLAAGAVPYLIDFNLAADPGTGLLRCGGTLAYMPPEHLRAILVTDAPPGEVSPRADVYAFGVILHQLLTGRVPYPPIESSDVRAVAADLLLKRQAGGAGAAPGGIPRRLADLIARCLADDPAARPASAEELVRELAAGGRPAPRRRWLRAAAAGLVAAAVGVAVVAAGRPNATPVEPAPPADDLERGRYHLARGDGEVALLAYRKAYAHRKDGRSAAHLAYCFGVLGQHDAAIGMAGEAIQAGYDTPAVRSNRAYSRLKKSHKDPAAPIDDLTVALARNPHLRAAQYNMALALFSRDFEPAQGLKNRACVQHIDRALAGEPLPAQLFIDAAQIYAAAAERKRAVDCLQEAVRRGRPPGQFLTDRRLARALAGDPRFARLADLGLGTLPDPPENIRLVDPDRGE